MLNPNIQNLELGINKVRNFDKLKVKQYDKNLRELKFIFIEDSEIVSIPEDYVAKIQVTLPSQETFMDDCEPITDGTTVIYKPSDLFTSVSGTIIAEIGFYKSGESSTDDGLIQSATFEIEVEKSAMDRNAIISSPQFNTLTIMINTITGLVENAEQTLIQINEAIDESNTATTLATNAATNANEKANLANTATTNANTATTNANNAATLANTKAELADMKAQEAQAIVTSAAPIINTNLQATYVDKATITGTFAHFTTADNGLAELFLNGKSYQNVTDEGKNKFDKAKVTAVRYIQPITGVVTTSSYNNNVSQLIPVTAGSTYTISGHTFVQPNTPVGIAWYNSSGVFISGATYQNANGNGTYTAPTGAAFVRYTINNVDLNTSQLELGSTATAYASYVGNSPSPDYSAPITPFNASGTAKARATRKNLLPKFSNQILSGVTMTVDSDGTIHLNGTATGNIFFYADNANSQNLMFISGDYALSLNNPSIAPLTFCFARRDSEASTYSITLNADIIDRKGTVTRTGNQVFLANRCYIYIASGSILNNAILKPQLELGIVATPYETPKSNEPPITFSGYDLPNGVKDAPDVQRTAVFTLNGTQTPIASFVQGDYFLAQFLPVIPAKPSFGQANAISAICDKLKVASNWLINIESFIHGSTNNNAFQIKVLSSRLTAATNAGLNTYLSQNPMTFVYERAMYIPLTPSRTFVTTYATETNISIIDPVQTTFTAVAKSELWSNEYLIKLNTINTDKIAQSDTTNDSGKVASSVVTHSHGQRLNAIESDIGDLGLLNTTSNTDLVSSINENKDSIDKISLKLSDRVVSVKDFGAVGNANYYNSTDGKWYADSLFTVLANDDTVAIQSAIDAVSPYIWKGSAASTTHAVQYGTIEFPRGAYRITGKLKLNAGIKLVGAGIEKGSFWNLRITKSSCIIVDYESELDFAFDTCPYDATGVRANNYLGEGDDVHLGQYSTAESIELHNLTFYTNKTIRGFNIALCPSFLMSNCYVKGFTLGIRFSATWYSAIRDTTFSVRWRGISATNSTNNLNLYNVGIAMDVQNAYISLYNDGCEYNSNFKDSCGIVGNWVGINGYGLTIEWFKYMVNLGNSLGEMRGIWTEEIANTLIVASYSNLIFHLVNIVCPNAYIIENTASSLEVISQGSGNGYKGIIGWCETKDVLKMRLKGFTAKTTDVTHMDSRKLRSTFLDNLNNLDVQASIYVDSVNGNDLNYGDTLDRPFATLRKALLYSQDLEKPVTIYLKSGQVFTISYTSISTKNLTITSYGVGDLPIVDFNTAYSGISFNIPLATINFKGLVLNNYTAKNDNNRNITSMSVRGVLNANFIDCSISLEATAQIIGAEAGGSYLANINYFNCTIGGYNGTFGRLSYAIWRDASKTANWNDIAINEYAFHTTLNSSVLGYDSANIIQKIHSTLDP